MYNYKVKETKCIYYISFLIIKKTKIKKAGEKVQFNQWFTIKTHQQTQIRKKNVWKKREKNNNNNNNRTEWDDIMICTMYVIVNIWLYDYMMINMKWDEMWIIIESETRIIINWNINL